MKNLLTLLITIITLTGTSQVFPGSNKVEGDLYLKGKLINSNESTTIKVFSMQKEDTVLTAKFKGNYYLTFPLEDMYEVRIISKKEEKVLYIDTHGLKDDNYDMFLDIDWKSKNDLCFLYAKDNEFEIELPQAAKSNK